MVIVGGKSKKNIDAYILLPPETKAALLLLIEKRASIGIPTANPYVFARCNSLTPLSGGVMLAEVVALCDNLKKPEKITSRTLRKYVATVSQVFTEFNF